MHRTPCSKLDYNSNECTALAREFSVFKSDCWKPSHLGSTSVMQTSQGAAPAFLYRQVFFVQTHTYPHTQHAGPVEAVAEVQSGAHLGWESLFLFHGLCFPLMMGPIVHASSGPAPFRSVDKAPFHKTKAGEEGGNEAQTGGECGEGSQERQKEMGRRNFTEKQMRVKSRKEDGRKN